MSLLVACNGNSTPTPTGYGTQYDVTEDGVVKTALDPSHGQFEEPVQSAPDWVEVRIGPQRQPIFLPKTDTPPDLSYYHFGRSGVQYPTKPTRVGVEIAGLDWHAGDSLQLVSPNVGGSMHDFEIHFDYPREGSSLVTNQTMNWIAAQAPLIDAAKSDRTWLAQMSNFPLRSGSQYSVITRVGLADNFSVADGLTSMLRTNLTPVALDRTLELRWKGAAFAALAAQAGPYTGAAAAPGIAVRSLPQALAENNNFYNRYFMYLPSLVDFGPIRSDADVTETISYGNPFSTGKTPWSDFVTVVYAMPVRIPGGGVTYAMVVQATPVDALRTGDLTPAISPVRNVKINGQDAGVQHDGVGASPMVSWDAPGLGTASTYTVTVQAIGPAVGGAVVTSGATFFTTKTSITLPESAMRDVSAYVLTVTAVSSKDRNLAARPFLATLPYASADYVTAKITQ